MQINDQQRKHLEFLAKEMRKVAGPVGPMHSWWDIILDIEAALKGFYAFLNYDSAEEMILEARSCFLHAKMEIPHEGIE
jgi:hypothetical protein